LLECLEGAEGGTYRKEQEGFARKVVLDTLKEAKSQASEEKLPVDSWHNTLHRDTQRWKSCSAQRARLTIPVPLTHGLSHRYTLKGAVAPSSLTIVAIV
jgi:hypothetical protein